MELMVPGSPRPLHSSLLLGGTGSHSKSPVSPSETAGEGTPCPEAGWELHTPHWALLVPPLGPGYQLSLLINNFALCQQFPPDILYLQVK